MITIQCALNVGLSIPTTGITHLTTLARTIMTTTAQLTNTAFQLINQITPTITTSQVLLKKIYSIETSHLTSEIKIPTSSGSPIQHYHTQVQSHTQTTGTTLSTILICSITTMTLKQRIRI